MDALERPGITSLLSAGPLPDGLKCLLRIVADGEWRDAATAHAYRAHDAETVRGASAAFLSEVLFARQTDPYRVLGLPTGAPIGEVREHKRLLLKWLHPDRNPEAKEQEHLARVIAAAEAIEGGRSDQFGTEAGRRPPPSSSPRPKLRAARQGKARPRARQALAQAASVTRRTAAGVIPGLLRATRLATIAIAIVLFGLIVWRQVMGEPIGASLSRYAKASLGLETWP